MAENLGICLLKAPQSILVLVVWGPPLEKYDLILGQECLQGVSTLQNTPRTLTGGDLEEARTGV